MIFDIDPNKNSLLVNVIFHRKLEKYQVESSVYDFFMKPGTVRMKVAFVLRSVEVWPVFKDFCL